MARTSLHDRLQRQQPPSPQGREALYQSEPPSTVGETVDRKRLTVDRKPSPVTAQKWEESHVRVTFHCPVDLVEAIEAEASDSGRTKSRVIVEAIRADLRRRSRHD